MNREPVKPDGGPVGNEGDAGWGEVVPQGVPQKPDQSGSQEVELVRVERRIDDEDERSGHGA